MRGIDVPALLLGVFVCRLALQPALSFLVHPSFLTSSSSRARRPLQQKQRLQFHDTRNDAQTRIIRDGTTTTVLAARRSPSFLSDGTVSCYRNVDAESSVYLVGVIHDSRRSCKVKQRFFHPRSPRLGNEGCGRGTRVAAGTKRKKSHTKSRRGTPQNARIPLIFEANSSTLGSHAATAGTTHTVHISS